jgi:uncharacterized protein YaiL (DUF2058 family)
MAGTRLWIQSVVLIEMLALFVWSAYWGLCHTEDALCRDLWAFITPLELAEISETEWKPQRQIAQVHSNDLEAWKSSAASVGIILENNNDNDISAVCDNPSSSLTQAHPLWLCSTSENTATRMVIKEGVTLVYPGSKEKFQAILSQLLPVGASSPSSPPPRTSLHVVLVVEEQDTSIVKHWTRALSHWTSSMKEWPCIETIQYEMVVTEQKSRVLVDENLRQAIEVQKAEQQRVVLEENGTSPEEALEDVEQQQEQVEPPVPKRLSQTQVTSLLKKSTLSSPSGDHGFQVILYIPSLLPLSLEQENTTWRLGEHQLLSLVTQSAKSNKEYSLVLDSALAGVSQWAARQMGLPSLSDLETDGSFPSWFWQGWWSNALQDLHGCTRNALEVTRQVLLHSADVAPSLVGKYSEAVKRWEDASVVVEDPSLTMRLLDQSAADALEIQRQLPMRTHFPVEHYLAIFAPLLFPLLLPFLTSLFREIKRYKVKTTKTV